MNNFYYILFLLTLTVKNTRRIYYLSNKIYFLDKKIINFENLKYESVINKTIYNFVPLF